MRILQYSASIDVFLYLTYSPRNQITLCFVFPISTVHCLLLYSLLFYLKTGALLFVNFTCCFDKLKIKNCIRIMVFFIAIITGYTISRYNGVQQQYKIEVLTVGCINNLKLTTQILHINYLVYLLIIITGFFFITIRNQIPNTISHLMFCCDSKCYSHAVKRVKRLSCNLYNSDTILSCF